MKIVYTSYLSDTIHKRTAFSILTFMKFHGLEHSIEVFTDKPEAFKGLEKHVTITKIDDKKLVEWTQEATWKNVKGQEAYYVWLVKPHIFKGIKESFIYLDSDTVLTKPLNDVMKIIDEENSVMHEKEIQLKKDERYHQLFENQLKDVNYEDLWMWNSGVLGIHEKHLGIFDEVINWTKKILKETPIFHVAEQFATGLLLQQRTTIHESRECVYHYWRETEKYDKIIKLVFERSSLEDLAKEYL